jgi:site-specific recombinase XerD
MMREHIESFIVARSYAAASAKQRRYLLQHFCEAVGDEPTVANVWAWWAGLAHLSEATRRAHLSAVRQFVKHLIIIGVMDSDPTVSITPPRLHQAPPVTITAEQARTFLAGVAGDQDRLACALMLGSGLRGGDVARLDVDGVDVDGRVLRVPGKGGRVRLVPIPEVVAAMLATHIGGRVDGPLIVTPGGHRMSAGQLRWRITRELTRAGIKHGPLDGRSSHVLRRTCATTLLQHGATLPETMQVLGHAQLSSTQRYLALPDAQRLQSVIEAGPLSAA